MAEEQQGAAQQKSANQQQVPDDSLPKGLQGGLRGLIYRLSESVFPEIHYLEGETKEIVIRMAEYRINVPSRLAVLSGIGLVFGAVLAFLSWRLPWPISLRTIFTGFALGMAWVLAHALEDLLLYEQWQFIVTDKRIILVTPDPEQRWLADAIYLKGGSIKVLDTNWSKRPFWGVFQASTGARDVTLSMGGYEFKEEGAKVKAGLRFPDMMPGDIIALEKLIFG